MISIRSDLFITHLYAAWLRLADSRLSRSNDDEGCWWSSHNSMGGEWNKFLYIFYWFAHSNWLSTVVTINKHIGKSCNIKGKRTGTREEGEKSKRTESRRECDAAMLCREKYVKINCKSIECDVNWKKIAMGIFILSLLVVRGYLFQKIRKNYQWKVCCLPCCENK